MLVPRGWEETFSHARASLDGAHKEAAHGRVSITMEGYTMRANSFIRSAVVLGVLALIACLPAVAAVAAQAEAQPTQIMAQSASAAVSPVQQGSLGETASGAVEDTLVACLSRIPEDASAGQRLIAKESCQRDKAERQPIDAVPGA